ncbi:MAG: TonB-dependent receptor domain-containing protein [Kofleriaceae bacterium]
MNRFAFSGLLFAAMGVVAVHEARAQSLTTGAIEGRVIDAKTGEAKIGVTVWAIGPTGEPQTAMTDERGVYKITELMPGDYDVTFYIDEITITRKRIEVRPNKTVNLVQRVKGTETPGIVFEVFDRPPQIVQDSPEKKDVYDQRAIKNQPNPGRDLAGVAGNTPGTHNDGVGLAVGGATGLENRFLVDGIDITGLTYGQQGTPVLTEFIEEIEVISGGFGAEWGRAVGGIINTITKSGTNTMRGSVFGTFTPGFLARRGQSTPVNASSIDVEAHRAYAMDFGAEVSGPIIRDKLFFFAGFAPQLSRTDYTRITKRQTDCRTRLSSGELSGCDPRLASQGGYADGAPDLDPETGFYITDVVDSEVRPATSQTYSAIGKLNLAVTPNDQAMVSFIAVPTKGETPGLYGLPSTGGRSSGLTTDAAARWTSKLGGGKSEVQVLAAWHRSTVNSGALDPALDNEPRQILRDGSLGLWSQLGGESDRTTQGCTDGVIGSSDPYPSITNCPMTTVPYATGGPGTLRRDREDRRMGRATFTHRGKLLGSHEVKGGFDIVQDRKTTARLFSGGAFIQNSVGAGQIDVTRWVQLAPLDNKDPRFDQTCRTDDPSPGGATMGTLSFACDYISGVPGAPHTMVEGETINWAAFIRDSWRPLTNLTINVGVRYEEQRLRYAQNLQNTADALTGSQLGKNAMTLKDNWAPRLGVIWDPSELGQSKVYASWGRHFESIPMDINDRSFGGEVSYVQTYQTGAGQPCGPTDPAIGGPNGTGCLMPNGLPARERLLGSSGVLVEPGIKAQYMDELLLGTEYQLAEDLKVGVTYQNRRLGRVIEDVSTDGANTYVIANPGEFSEAEQATLEERIARVDDPVAKGRLQRQLDMFKGIRMFDKPTRRYDALEVSIVRRFSKGLMVKGAYTHSRTVGNYPGLVSYDNGQIDPNISSQYDLIELLANRQGKLPQDRPHSVKIDGNYTFDLGLKDALTIGSRIRYLSGIPMNALGAHSVYGPDESFLLPRGAMGRSEYEHGIDVHLSYGRRINKTMVAEFYFDVFNLYNKQGTFDTDQTYAPSVRLASAQGGGASENNVNPIVGGDYEDLIWAKTIDGAGNESSVPTARNPNFGKTASRYAPTSARIGFRLTF